MRQPPQQLISTDTQENKKKKITNNNKKLNFFSTINAMEKSMFKYALFFSKKL